MELAPPNTTKPKTSLSSKIFKKKKKKRETKTKPPSSGSDKKHAVTRDPLVDKTRVMVNGKLENKRTREGNLEKEERGRVCLAKAWRRNPLSPRALASAARRETLLSPCSNRFLLFCPLPLLCFVASLSFHQRFLSFFFIRVRLLPGLVFDYFQSLPDLQFSLQENVLSGVEKRRKVKAISSIR